MVHQFEPTVFSDMKHLPLLEENFAQGNYSFVAMQGEPDAWQTYAALGLVGKAEDALAGLRQFYHQEARFYEGVTHWIDGDDEMALYLLKDLTSPFARNLAAFIRKPKIQVLAQLPWLRQGASNLMVGAKQDDKFCVRNISLDPRDLPNEPYANIWKFVDRSSPPDFYLCQLLEWHLIPPNLQELPCPLFAQTSDYDVHIQNIYPWLHLFDEFVVSEDSEWKDMRRLVKVPVSGFPKTFGVPFEMTELAASKREIDVFVSGTLFHPYHPDKAKLFHEVIRMPHLKMQLYNGFLNDQCYKQMLGNSKVCFTYCRHTGATVTRGLEALSMGCATVVQQDCVLQLYLGEQDGVLSYGKQQGELERSIRRVLDDWPRYEHLARQGAKRVREEFDLSRVASQYLRFLTVLASRPRVPRNKVPTTSLRQKKSVLSKGCMLRTQKIRWDLLQANMNRFNIKKDDHWDRPSGCIDMAREIVLAHAQRVRQTNLSLGADSMLVHALNLYRFGMSRFPRSLVLRFNFMRVALHFGRPSDVSEALDVAMDAIARPLSRWEIDELEDVFPWDFFEDFFNYREYFDRSVSRIQGDLGDPQSLARLIMASICYYLTYYSDRSFQHAQQAVSLDPEFPFYQFRYCLELLNRENPADNAEAEKGMMNLARKSMLWREVYEVIADRRGSQTAGWQGFSEVQELFNSTVDKVRLSESWRVLPQLRPALSKELVEEGGTHATLWRTPMSLRNSVV